MNTSVKQGKCTNYHNCTQADKGATVSVSVGLPFDCPECGKKLSESETENPSLVKIIVVAIALVLVVGMGFSVYKIVGQTSQTSQTGQTGCSPEDKGKLCK